MKIVYLEIAGYDYTLPDEDGMYIHDPEHKIARYVTELEERIEKLEADIDSETKWAKTYLDAFVKVRDAARPVLRWLVRTNIWETTVMRENLQQALKDTEKI